VDVRASQYINRRFFKKLEKVKKHKAILGKETKTGNPRYILQKACKAAQRFEKRKEEEEGVVVCCISGATGTRTNPFLKLAYCSCRHVAKPSLPVAAAATQSRTADLHHIPCMQRQTLKSKTLTRPTSKRWPNSRQPSTAECRGREIQSDHHHRCPRPASQPVPMIR
jgi:(p)ppGpp synthase/HD superfamily hydrolase